MAYSLQTFNRVKMAQNLFFLNAIIWLVFGSVSLISMENGDSDRIFTLLVIAMMMFGNAGAMAFSGWGIGKARKSSYYLAVAVLIVNIILTVTDQFGIFDLITLIIDLVLLGTLCTVRKRYA
jgi:hypothetical protein